MTKVKPRLERVTEAKFRGVAEVARRVGCHPVHLSYVLHGRRKCNDELRRRLARLGVTQTVDGEEL